jgi:hypothetical protein
MVILPDRTQAFGLLFEKAEDQNMQPTAELTYRSDIKRYVFNYLPILYNVTKFNGEPSHTNPVLYYVRATEDIIQSARFRYAVLDDGTSRGECLFFQVNKDQHMKSTADIRIQGNHCVFTLRGDWEISAARSAGGAAHARFPPKKRPTARRLRSSKRKARKARATRRR